MAQFKNYNPMDYQLIVGNHTVTGVMDGSYFKASRNEETFSFMVGGDGEVCRIRNSDTSGTIQITLLESSDSNLVFSQLYNTDEKSSKGTFSVLLKRNGTETSASGTNGWFIKPADIVVGKNSIEGRMWNIHVAHMEMLHDGLPSA